MRAICTVCRASLTPLLEDHKWPDGVAVCWTCLYDQRDQLRRDLATMTAERDASRAEVQDLKDALEESETSSHATQVKLREEIEYIRSRANSSDDQLCQLAKWLQESLGVNNNSVIGKNGWPFTLVKVVSRVVDDKLAAARAENERLRNIAINALKALAERGVFGASAEAAALAAPADAGEVKHG